MNGKQRHPDGWWNSSPWDFAVVAICLAFNLASVDLNDPLRRLALIAFTIWCCFLLEKAVRVWRACRRREHDSI
ncbi:hypothetical protein Pan44_19850 [Caulifigura coniformis]|uniref:Uncharacterized protein n=1 Tax=Caulifigura coniformis TaxID=2527983 RepID=A0A517SCW1_9PLAN|nr:hypothetical protein [Caulifigura coniformis]QDT53958.1 hypothetical protein Pan44_19850 [Caulifigura coniformis]